MITSFIVDPKKYYPDACEQKTLPRTISHRMAYGICKTWSIRDSWCCMQWYKSKNMLPYSIEIEAKESLYLPVEVIHPDIHWQYALKGGYGITEVDDGCLILQENQHHMIYAQQGEFISCVPPGRHLIMGYNIQAAWLDRHINTQVPSPEDMPFTLLPNRLYQNAPAPITAAMYSEVYYILQHPKISGIQQDTNIYAAIGRLQTAHTVQGYDLSPGINNITQIITSIHIYISQLLNDEISIPSISQLAEQYHVKQDFLGKMHKKLHQISLQEHINNKKMDWAAEQILQQRPIYTIAWILGYSEVSAFRRAFKNKFGVPPSEYKQYKDLQNP